MNYRVRRYEGNAKNEGERCMVPGLENCYAFACMGEQFVDAFPSFVARFLQHCQ